MKYVCPICGYVYDEEKEGVPFADLPDSWTCPLCGADKSAFEPEQPAQSASEDSTAHVSEQAHPASVAPETAAAYHEDDPDDLRQLSAGEIAALCSNLARGCEKQYKFEEAALFARIADYFTAAAPEEPGADIDHLAALIQGDLSDRYPAVRSAAANAADRGTLRVCTWGEKVTAILNSLVKRWQTEGEAFVASTHVWVCTICGFVYVGDTPPELCPVCKVPAWKFERIEGRVSA